MALEKKIAAAFLIALTITLMIGIVSYRSINLLIETSREVERSYRILAQMEKVFSLLKDAESSVRDYVLTGDDRYLEPYSHSDQIIEQIREFQQWMRNQDQKSDLANLIPLVQTRLSLLQQSLEIRATKGPVAANEWIATGQGRNVMEQIRRKIQELVAEENRLLKLTLEKQSLASQRSVFTIVLGSILAVLTVIVGGVLIFKDLETRRRVEEESRKSRLFLDPVLENINDMAAGSGQKER